MVPQSGTDINAYISLCLGVTLSFSAAMSLVLLWRWAHQRGQEGLPTLNPGRTTTGIEPETVASFAKYRYHEDEGYSVAARAASSRHAKAEDDAGFDELVISRGRSEPALPSPKIAAANAADPIK